jgi:hypothetical protein
MTAISHDQSKGIIQDTADVQNFASSVCLAVEHNLLPRDMFKHLTTLSLSVTPNLCKRPLQARQIRVLFFYNYNSTYSVFI